MLQEERKYIDETCYIRMLSNAEIVSVNGEIHIPLSPTEYNVISFFLENANRPIRLEDLAEHIWGINYEADNKDPYSLKSTITRLRKKLAQVREGLRANLKTNYGFGSYTFVTNYSNKKKNTGNYQLELPQYLNKDEIKDMPHIVTKHVPFFVDERDIIHREKDITKLIAMFSNGKEAVSISGLGGIGKTSIARILYSKLASRYDCVGWVDYLSDIKTSILTAFSTFDNIQNQEERWSLILNHLRNGKQSVLLFVDNVNRDFEKQQNPLADYMLSEISGYSNLSIVLTSRIDRIKGYHTFNLKDLSDEDSEDLFYYYYNKHSFSLDIHQRIDRKYVQKIIIRAANNPFAIELLAKSARRASSLESFSNHIINVGFQLP